LVVVGDDVVDGEPDDPADPLCVEQDDDSGDSGSQREVVTGEKLAEQGYVLAVWQRSVSDLCPQSPCSDGCVWRLSCLNLRRKDMRRKGVRVFVFRLDDVA
jgi:hypothetical protein